MNTALSTSIKSLFAMLLLLMPLAASAYEIQSLPSPQDPHQVLERSVFYGHEWKPLTSVETRLMAQAEAAETGMLAMLSDDIDTFVGLLPEHFDAPFAGTGFTEKNALLEAMEKDLAGDEPVQDGSLPLFYGWYRDRPPNEMSQRYGLAYRPGDVEFLFAFDCYQYKARETCNVIVNLLVSGTDKPLIKALE